MLHFKQYAVVWHLTATVQGVTGFQEAHRLCDYRLRENSFTGLNLNHALN